MIPLRRCLPALLFFSANLDVGRATDLTKPDPKATAEAGQPLYAATCAVCHGDKGQGNPELKTPSIAHLPAWYVIHQIDNFRSSKRGTHPEDPQGLQMAAIAKTLDQEKIDSVALYVESLALVVPKDLAIEGANVSEGQYLFEARCMECHRYNASGEYTFGSPPLVGRQGWYLMAQLKKFQEGHRGAAKDDDNGAKMALTSTFVQGEQAIKDVVSYILTLNPPPEPAAEGSPFEKDR
ncbi:MAG: cytochrome c [Verrucomicrobiales bacterium]|nr:cytochrome c [Verrucomicrobiales bacterium]